MYHFGKYHSIGIDKKGMINKNAFHAFFSLLTSPRRTTYSSAVCVMYISRYFGGCFHNTTLHEVTYRMSHRIGNTSVWHIWSFWCILPSTYLHLNVCHQVRINVVRIVSKLSIKNKQRRMNKYHIVWNVKAWNLDMKRKYFLRLPKQKCGFMPYG